MLSLVNDKETELLEFFCKHPTTEFSVSEISDKTGISKPWVSKKIDKFADKNIIKSKKDRNRKIATFNRNNERSIRLKQLINLDQFYNSSVIDKIIEKYSYPEAVILFGSFAKGEDVESSDIDIAVVTTERANIESDIMNREVAIKEFEPGKIPENMIETFANGITVYGYLEVNE